MDNTKQYIGQQRALDMCANREHRRGTLLNMAMGTGKTRTAIERMKIVWDTAREQGKTPVFIISCPVVLLPDMRASNPGGWLGEFRKWWPDFNARIDSYMDKRGTTALRARVIRDLCKDHATGNLVGVPLVLVQSYESWRQPDMVKVLMAIGNTKIFYKMLICDESHRAKTPSSSTAKVMHKLSDKCDEVLCLTGTPMPHSPLDLWSQARLMTNAFGDNYYSFRSRYAYFVDMPVSKKGASPVKVFRGMKKDMADEFREKMDTFTYSLTLDDALDLPSFTKVDIDVELGPREYKVYKDMEKKLFAEIAEDVNVTAPNVLSKISKLSQITGGSIKLEDGTVQSVGHSKADVLKDFLTNDVPEDEPVVVFCRFIADIDLVKDTVKSVGRESYELSGRRKQLEGWRGDNTGSVIVVQESAGGVGIDLTRSHYVVFYSINYSLGDLDQAFARVYRAGQEFPVSCVSLVAGGTIDEVIRDSVVQKRNVVDIVLGRCGREPIQGTDDRGGNDWGFGAGDTGMFDE